MNNDYELNKLFLECLEKNGYSKYVKNNVIFFSTIYKNNIKLIYKNNYLTELVKIECKGSIYTSIFDFVSNADYVIFDINILVRELLDLAIYGNDFNRLKRALKFADIYNFVDFNYIDPENGKERIIKFEETFDSELFDEIVECKIPFHIKWLEQTIYISWHQHGGKLYHQINNTKDNDCIITERDIQSLNIFKILKSI